VRARGLHEPAEIIAAGSGLSTRSRTDLQTVHYMKEQLSVLMALGIL
jgi:hypothetical protein